MRRIIADFLDKADLSDKFFFFHRKPWSYTAPVLANHYPAEHFNRRGSLLASN